MTLLPHIPINCNCYDILLAKARLKNRCHILYINEAGNFIETEAIITDVYTKAKEEFLQLDNGMVIRLDKIISVDNQEIVKGSSL